MHAAQLGMLSDTHRRKLFLGSRRCGKTYVCNGGLIEAADAHPGATALYLSLTGKSARSILWPGLLTFNRKYVLCMKPHAASMQAECPNGSIIEVAGADAENAVERLRGRPYSRVIVDEPASFHPRLLKYLLQEVIGPGLRDYEGDLWLTGSPGAILAGYFYEACEGAKAWTGHIYKATMRDNPFFAGRAERLLAEAREEYGWTEASPAYQREYEGRWIRDDNSLVFDFRRDRNMVSAAPVGMRFVVAVDLGASKRRETTAFVVIGYVPGGAAYVVHAKRHADFTPSDIGAELGRLVEQYKPHTIVMDAGGLGGGYVTEMQRRFKLPVQAAQKADRYAYVDLLAGDIRTGKVLAVDGACGDLVEELEVLQWNDKRDNFDDRFLDHCTDGLIYGWRECRQYLGGPAKPKKEETEDERMERLEDERARRLWWQRRR
jgi:hypothetical protein